MEQQSKSNQQEDTLTHILIGTMVKNEPRDIWAPSEYCLEEEGNLYQGFDYRLGDTNLVFPSGIEPEKFAHEPVVIIEGHYEADLTRHIKKIGKCDPDTFVIHMQMRGDWGNPESGSAQGLTTRARLKELSWFQVVRVEAEKFVSYEAQYVDSVPEKLSLTFTNIFADPLPEVPFSLHYEGGLGKPMPVYIDEKIPALAPGESHTHTLPVVHSKGTDPISHYVFSSLELNQEVPTEGKSLSFHLDIPFYKLGISEGYPNYRRINRKKSNEPGRKNRN